MVEKRGAIVIYAEARALYQGLFRCYMEGRIRADVEVDSMVLIQILLKNTKVPRVIGYEIRLLFQMLDKMDIVLTHAYRENNKGEDFF